MNPSLVVNVMSKALLWNSAITTFSSFFDDCISTRGMNKLKLQNLLTSSIDFYRTSQTAYNYCRLNPNVSYSGVFTITCKKGNPTGVLFTAKLGDPDDQDNPNLFYSLIALGDHLVSSYKYQSVINNNTLKAKEVIALMTSRELEVLRLISLGKTTKEIANLLFISTHTVDTHKQKLYQKLNVRNTAELGKMAERYGISDND